MGFQMKVMVVHSDPVIVAYLATILEEFDCEVVSETARLDDAKKTAQEIKPEIAFIDAELVDGNKGYRLAVHLAAQYKTHVIMMSENSDVSEITGFDGTFHWINMPYSEKQITEEIGDALRAGFRAGSLSSGQE